MWAATVAAAMIAWPAHQADAQAPRQLEAHQHGHGTLDIAVEGRTLQVGLEVPGADIVGFEHAATTDADKRKVAAAKKKLADASALLVLPARAGCKLVSADVGLEGYREPEGEMRQDEKPPAHGGETAHAEFFAEYEFNCANVAAVTQITFNYFRTFPNAEGLDVTLVTARGQKTFAVNRGNTRIDLRDMM
jgi:hypothetical protein